MILKKVFTICLFVLMFSTASAQTHKFISSGFTVKERNSRGQWGPWSEFQKSDVVISLDTEKDRIIIYSQELQHFKIVSYHEKTENESDIIYGFSCTDDNGVPFVISIITRKTQGNRRQMYINHKNVIVAYNISTYDEKKGARKERK